MNTHFKQKVMIPASPDFQDLKLRNSAIKLLKNNGYTVTTEREIRSAMLYLKEAHLYTDFASGIDKRFGPWQ